MNNHTLVFHIGTMKTGTTALQKFLYESPELLEKWGWYYPNFHNEFWAHTNGIPFGTPPSKKTIKTGASEEWESLWKHLEVYLDKGNVIISNEGFWTSNCLEIFQIAKKKQINVKVIVYLRRQDIFLESMYKETIRLYFETRNFADWLEDKLYTNDCYHAHYYKYLRDIEKIVGHENIIVRVFEKQQMIDGKQDIVRDFMHTLIPKFDEELKVIQVNEQLSAYTLEIKKIFNSIVQPDIYTIDRFDFMDLFSNLSQLYKEPMFAGRYGYMCKDERMKFMKEFQDENMKIAQRYLGRQTGVLFYDNEYDIPQIDVKYSVEEKTIVAYISMIYMQLNRLIKKQNGKPTVWRNIKDKIDGLKGNRQIVLFGAGFKCGMYQSALDGNISFILDNDEKKRGNFLGPHKILLPRDVINWKEYYIVVTNTMFAEVETQLEEIGLERNKDYFIGEEYLKNSGV